MSEKILWHFLIERENMKQKNLIMRAWVCTAVYLLIGTISIFWGGVKNIGNFYGISLVVALALPFFYAILTTFRIKMPVWLSSFGTIAAYMLIVITLSFTYQIQSFLGYFVLLFMVVFYAVLAVFYALLKTWRNRKNGKCYYIDGKKEKVCSSFGAAFKEYYLEGLTSGIIDGILTAIFSF